MPKLSYKNQKKIFLFKKPAYMENIEDKTKKSSAWPLVIIVGGIILLIVVLKLIMNSVS